VKWLSPLSVKVARGSEFRYKCGDKLYNNSSLHSHCRKIKNEKQLWVKVNTIGNDVVM